MMQVVDSSRQSIIINRMRVNKTEIKYQTSIDYDKVILKIGHPFEEFLKHIEISQYGSWNSKRLGQKYHLTKLQQNVVKFDYQYVFIETDHKDLLSVIQNILHQFTAYSIEYPIKYEEIMQVFKEQIDKLDCFIASNTEGKHYRTFTFYYYHDIHQIQEIQLKINRLSELCEQTLIYPLNDYIRSKMGGSADSDVGIFLRELLKHYKDNICEYLNSNMNRIGLRGNIYIQKMDYFSQDDFQKLKALKIELSGFSEYCGLIFITYGYQDSYSKLQTFLEKWLDKLSTAVVEVDHLECCSRDQLPEYFRTAFPNSHATILTHHTQKSQRILIFDPPKDTHSPHDLHHFFKSANRIITGLQYPECDFKLLHQYWNQFVSASSLSMKAKIYPDYLMINCSRGQEIKLRDKIKEFLEVRKKEQTRIDHFQNMFEISIFKAVYLRQMLTKGVDFYLSNGALYRHNFVKDSDDLDSKLRDIYQKMKKALVFVPVPRSLPKKQDYFRESRAISWQNPECLQNHQFKIEKKVTIHIRCFASICQNQEDCIFVVEDIKKCTELIEVLKEQGSSNIEQRLTSNPMLGFALRYSKYLNSLTACRVTLGSDRQKRWIRRLKQTFEELISQHQSSRHIKFMFHEDSQESIKILVPIIVDSIRSNCNLRAECKLKEVTFFTSLKGGSSLRTAIVAKLKQVREKSVAITKVCDLHLRKGQLEKIIAYGYYSFKYFEDDETRQSSPLSSFIFQSELKKRKKTPIFLPEPAERTSNKKAQYLISCFDETAFRIIARRIEKIPVQGRLAKLKSIMKKYFPIIEYFTIFGNAEGTYFCQRLFYTSTEQRHYKMLEKVSLDVEAEKIIVQKKLMNYQLIANQFLELKRVETHPNKIRELMEMMNGTML